MQKLRTWLKKHHIIYVNRSFERAYGMDLSIPDFSIISNISEFAKQHKQDRSHIVLIKDATLLDSWQLLTHPKALTYITEKKQKQFGGVVIFKNNKKIERICAENNIPLLNPPADLVNTIEQKISQVAWLNELQKYLPPTQIDICKNISWNFEPFVLQFNQGHTGSGTTLIEHEKQLQELQKRFPERPVRISAYIRGTTFTCNTIVSKDAVHVGSLSYQITGLMPFTNTQFATIGNDWQLPHTILSYEQQAISKEIANAVGKKMQQEGWRGAFGIDVIVEEQTGNVNLLEINARQAASVTFESQLQQYAAPKSANNLMTTFEAHIAALAGLSTKDHKLIPVKTGAQIVLRLWEKTKKVEQAQLKKELEDAGFFIISYRSDAPGSDMLRIQSKESIMEKHATFNTVGGKIMTIIEKYL
tara:strand:- start:786 stop:2036 length:1251 start_codon:yes stop_codon:yes gene_type:complete